MWVNFTHKVMLFLTLTKFPSLISCTYYILSNRWFDHRNNKRLSDLFLYRWLLPPNEVFKCPDAFYVKGRWPGFMLIMRLLNFEINKNKNGLKGQIILFRPNWTQNLESPLDIGGKNNCEFGPSCIQNNYYGKSRTTTSSFLIYLWR